MASTSRKYATSKGWDVENKTAKPRKDFSKASLENLPYDILIRLLSLSLELNLMHTSHTIREKLIGGIGIDKAFSVGAKTISLVALMPPYSWSDRFAYHRDVGFMDVERSQNTAQHLILQEKVFNSGWFTHPRIVCQLLPQAIKITLEKIMVTAEAGKVMKDMHMRCPNILSLGNSRSSADYEFLSIENGRKGFLNALNAFQLFVRDKPSHHRFSGNRVEVVPVIAMCHIPGALLQPPFNEEKIQLLWIFHKMIGESRFRDRRVALRGQEKFEISIDEARLVTAIEAELSEGNVDAVRQLVDIRATLLFARNLHWDYSIEPHWYLIAARSSNGLMLHNLAQMDLPDAEYRTRSIPFWDTDLFEGLSVAVSTLGEKYASRLYARLEKFQDKLDSFKLPDGNWKRIRGPDPCFINDDLEDLGYEEWMSHRQERSRQMASFM